jgi:CheY-like chemotaxis protein
MTILIVDDVELIRTMLTDYLDDAGYVAAGAGDGHEALKFLRTQPCQLVLLDVMMPIMNGWEILQVITTDPSLATIPVVILSAAENVHEIALEQGASGYLTKPINFDLLMHVVRYHVRA